MGCSLRMVCNRLLINIIFLKIQNGKELFLPDIFHIID